MCTTTTEADDLISIPAAAKRLGLTRWALASRIQSGLLPAYRIAPVTSRSRLRVRVSDVDALLIPVKPRDS